MFAKHTVLTAIALTLATASASHASDLCVTYLTGPSLTITSIVLKGFRAPSPGKCRPAAGERTTGPYGAYVLTGSACTSTDGSTMRLVLNGSSLAYIDQTFVRANVALPLGGTVEIDEQDINGTAALISGPNVTTCKSQPLL